MIVHNFDPVFVNLGPIEIRWYSLAYILGIILGWVYATKIIKLTSFKPSGFVAVNKLEFDELLIYLVLGIVFGGRLGYVLFYNISYYSENLIEIFKFWQGGMSFHGGLLGIIVAIYLYSKKNQTNFFKYSDIVSCAAPIGLFFGRIANFINGELIGKISTLPWATIFPDSDAIARHPSQIYQAILEGVVLFILINFLAIKRKLIFKTGYISSLFLIFYSILRIFGEFFREPDSHIGYLFNYYSMGTILSLITLIFGFFILIYIKNNEQNN
tara:strand:+ start:48 stop:857 length:810 start_codon:yes stop_codon:yes gene_type:complete